MSSKYLKINNFNQKEIILNNNLVSKQATKNDKINKVVYKNKKLKIGKKCARCGWWIESGELATQWNKINIYTHIKCNR